MLKTASFAADQEDYGQAQALEEESLVLSRIAGCTWASGTVLSALAQIARTQGHYRQAHALAEEALAPARLALVTILQFAENLSDRQAAEAVRARLDWKYRLALDVDDPGFDASVLSEFRTRLLAHNAEHRLFDTLLAACRAHGLLKARGRQRTDSTHVLAAVRALNRLALVTETMRHALNVLATVVPDWIRAHSLEAGLVAVDQHQTSAPLGEHLGRAGADS